MSHAQNVYEQMLAIQSTVAPMLGAGQYDLAESLLFSELGDARERRDEIGSWIAKYFLGICAQRAGLLPPAERRLLEVVHGCGDKTICIFALQGLGKSYSEAGLVDSALACLNELTLWRKNGVLLSDGEFSAVVELPALWRLGVYEVLCGQTAKGESDLKAHAELATPGSHQAVNELSCFVISSLLRGKRDFDRYYDRMKTARGLYMRSLSQDGTFWKVKSSVSTLLVEAAIDRSLNETVSALMKVFVVRLFLKKWHLRPTTEGIGDLLSTLKVVFPEMEDILHLSDRRLPGWLRRHLFGASAVRAETMARRLVMEWEARGDEVGFLDIDRDLDGARRGTLVTTDKARRRNRPQPTIANTGECVERSISFDFHELSRGTSNRLVRVGLAHLPVTITPSSWPPTANDTAKLGREYLIALNEMVAMDCQILCFPEYAYTEEVSPAILDRCHERFVIAGSAYTQGYNRCRVLYRGHQFDCDKIIPGDFEYGGLVVGNEGMNEGHAINIFSTEFGRIAVLVCRDFIRLGPALQDVAPDIVVVVAHNLTEEGCQRIHATAQYLVKNLPVYILVTESGVNGRSFLMGRLHRSFVESLNARGIRRREAPGEEIVSLSEPGIIAATLDLACKSPIIPSPASPQANVSAINLLKFSGA